MNNHNSTVSITCFVAAGYYPGLSNTNITLGGPQRIIGSYYPQITISGSTNNQGEQPIFDFNGTQGWTIFSYPNNLSIKNLIFINMLGVGLAFRGNLSSSVNVSGCTFQNNTISSGVAGSALHVHVNSVGNHVLQVTNSTFTLNTQNPALLSYGPVVVLSGIVQFTGCTFTFNQQNYGPLVLYSPRSNQQMIGVTVMQSSFTNNVGNNSASIYSYIDFNSTYQPTMYFQNTITNNVASGGNIFTLIQGSQGIGWTNISNNTAKHALYVDTPSTLAMTTISNCSIMFNTNIYGAPNSRVGVGLFCQPKTTVDIVNGTQITNNYNGSNQFTGPSINTWCSSTPTTAPVPVPVTPTPVPAPVTPNTHPSTKTPIHVPTFSPSVPPSNNIALKVLLPLFLIAFACAVAAGIYYWYWVRPQSQYTSINNY